VIAGLSGVLSAASLSRIENGLRTLDRRSEMHTTLVAGRDVAELLDLAVLLHTGGTNQWLRVMGASPDLRSQAATLAQQAARDRDTPTAMGHRHGRFRGRDAHHWAI
jgi:hypothetical protein